VQVLHDVIRKQMVWKLHLKSLGSRVIKSNQVKEMGTSFYRTKEDRERCEKGFYKDTLLR
jgi:hypothetical protein